MKATKQHGRAAVGVVVASLAAWILIASVVEAWPVPKPPGGGLKVYVAKKAYQVGEPIKFMLYKHAGADDTPANLEDSYYIIESRKGNKGREFYTSDREPFGKVLDLETEQLWSWDQRDNEQTHRAWPGQWRLLFYAPKGNIGKKPLKVYFKIE